MQITNISGEQEKFSKSKFCTSLRKAGVDKATITELCEKVSAGVKPGTTTSNIFREASRYLIKRNPAAAARYNIKRGIAELGPAGFLFEQYIEVVMRTLGYKTRRNVMMRGQCVTHEVDVLAKNNSEHAIIEVKYRNERKIKTHLDVVMYAEARREDIAKARRRKKDCNVPHIMWVITNTRFTSQCIKYAKCKGMRLTGWSYPKGASLEEIVTKHALYPVTTLPSVNRPAREIFAQHNMMLAQDIAPYSARDLEKKFGINKTSAQKIAREAHALVFGTVV